MSISLNSNLIQGRKKIEFAISKEDFLKDPIEYTKKLLPKCLTILNENKRAYEYIKRNVVGRQDILNKIRSNGDNEINNKVVENHLWRQLNFKTSFVSGSPIDYSTTITSNYDDDKSDLTYLKKYDKDALRYSKDIDKYQNIYMYGHAYRMIMPKKVDIDIESESPYEIINLENDNTFCVYEQGIHKRKLFSCIITKRLDLKNLNNISNIKTYYTIYLDEEVFELEENLGSDYKISKEKVKQPYNQNPIIEYRLNQFMISIPELVMYLQNGLNALNSLQFDDIEEFVNAYIVFENMELDDAFLEDFKRNKKDRILNTKTTNPNTPAKVSLLKVAMDHSDIQILYERIISSMYDIVACPRASGNVTSGGDTGQARLLGNGWETAQNQAQIDTTFFTQYEYEELKIKLYICKLKRTNIDKITASDIDIKYSINMSDNLLIKAEALKMLNEMNFPKEASLNMVKITNDSHGIALEWEKASQNAKANEGQNTNQVNDSDDIKNDREV